MYSEWDIYADQTQWPLSGKGIFLARAVSILGEASSVAWNDEIPTYMQLKPLPAIANVEDAFDSLSQPIPEVHRAFVDSINLIKTPGTFAAECLSQAEWVRSLVPNPEGGEALPSALLRARRGEDLNDPITIDHWEDVSIQSCWHREGKRGGEEHMRLIGSRLQSAILHHRVRTYIRPIGGSLDGAVPLDESFWEMDDPLPRLAWCGLDLMQPLDPSVPPSHWIFVNSDDLTAELSNIEQVVMWDLEPASPASPKAHGFNGRIMTAVFDFLIDAFQRFPERTPKDQFRAEAELNVGWAISETNWRHAWKRATEIHPNRIVRGRPRVRPITK